MQCSYRLFVAYSLAYCVYYSNFTSRCISFLSCTFALLSCFNRFSFSRGRRMYDVFRHLYFFSKRSHICIRTSLRFHPSNPKLVLFLFRKQHFSNPQTFFLQQSKSFQQQDLSHIHVHLSSNVCYRGHRGFCL